MLKPQQAAKSFTNLANLVHNQEIGLGALLQYALECSIIAGDKEFQSLIENELNGYKSPVPEYRMIAGVIVVVNLDGSESEVSFESTDEAELFRYRALGESIFEIADLAKQLQPTDKTYISLSPKDLAIIQTSLATRRAIRFRVNASQILSIPDKVRISVFKWALTMSYQTPQRMQPENISKAGESMDEIDFEFNVFISHGRNPVWKDFARFIESKLNLTVIELEEQTNRGRTIIEKLEQTTDDCHFALVVMTAEDEQASGLVRTRQNVVHEIGYLQGKFGRENVIVLKENGVEEFTNLSGIVYEGFDSASPKSAFERIRTEIKEAIASAENEEDE